MTYGVYPNSTPEFRMVHKANGTTVMQVRYIHASAGYIGKWVDVQAEKENDAVNQPETSSHV